MSIDNQLVYSPWRTSTAWRTYVAGALWISGVIVAARTQEPDIAGWLRVRMDVAGLILAAAAFVGGWNFFPKAFRGLRRFRLDMNFLMTVAIVGAILIGEPIEAAAIAALFSFAELLEAAAVIRARRAVQELLRLTPEEAMVVSESGEEHSMPTEQLRIGHVVRVRPGEKIPIDGNVLDGESGVDESTVTGESVPVTKTPGEPVYAGSTVAEGYLEIEATTDAGNTTLARIVRFVRQAQARRARSHELVDDRRCRMLMRPALPVALLIFARMTGTAAQMPHRESTGSGWSVSSHGFVTLNYRNDGGPRGASGRFSTSMLMVTGSRPALGGVIEFRTMGSLDPLMGPDGYPLLYQTGETADGLVPLVDRQHPHDAIIELGVKYTWNIDDHASAFLYVAPVGEPAIGPPVFLHRQSAGSNPAAPISHHWLDATHITAGVVTAGVTANEQLTLELSAFNGSEPDEVRWGLATPRLNSWAFRATVKFSDSWSMQGSAALMTEPEQLHPGIDVVRLTSSLHYRKTLGNGAWETTFAWGRNRDRRTIISLQEAQETFSEPVLNHYVGLAGLPDLPADQLFLLFPSRIQTAVLLESAIYVNRFVGFLRSEYARKDELFPPTDLRHSTLYDLGKVDIGGSFDAVRLAGFALRIGVSGSLHVGESTVREIYGRIPTSWMLFSQLAF